VKSEETKAIEGERRMREMVKDADGSSPDAFLVRLNPRVTGQFIGENARMLHALEEDTGKFFSFEGSEGLPLNHFAITLEGTRDEVVQAAVPFRDGEEVHVNIVEPHMYEVDDAVAKIDGYIISVHGAGPFVGQKRLVRIESAGRTSATAVLIDLTDAERERIDREKAEAAKPKRRGTRGGRTKKKDPEPAKDSASQEEEDAKVKASTGPAGKTESDGGEEKPARRGRARARKKDEEAPEEDSAATEAEGEDEDALESKPRRRGRRGGRRRSRAKADEAGAGEATEASE
jgi:ribonuclease G